jgi:hypothetical protein
MPTIESLGVTPYLVGAPQIIPNVPLIRNEHYMYTTAGARINAAWVPDAQNPAVKHFQGTANAAGMTFYLPYEDDKITSVRLPVPPPAGADFFLTANMSGCKFFVDAIIGSNDLMVYHANTHQHAAPAHNSPLNFQSPQADGVLNTLHANARNDYAGLPAPNNLALVNVASLAKPVYYGGGALAEQRKANQGRTLTIGGHGPQQVVTPEFVGGCSVMGFYTAGTWRFYYQTWGDVEYDRPTGAGVIAKKLFTGQWNYVHKARVEGGRHQPGVSSFKVVEHGRFYPP